MNIDEILQSNDLGLIKRHLRRLYDNYEIATKTQLDSVTEKIELLKQTEQLKKDVEFHRAWAETQQDKAEAWEKECERIESQLSEKDKELSELKEKHIMCNVSFKDWIDKHPNKDTLTVVELYDEFKQYYTQTHGQ